MNSPMRALDPSHVLELAERGRAKSPPERAVLLLAAAYPEHNEESLANLTLSERDALLLTLRERTFGKKLRGLINCPACHLALSLDIDIDTFRSEARHSAHTHLARVADYEIRFRIPNTGDLLALKENANPERAWMHLFERCVLEARCARQPVPASTLPPEIAEEISRLIDEADPLADPQLAMECPGCGKSWRQAFDIAAYLWEEVAALARQLLVEVHALASVYGWSEERILGMSAWRRGMYLAMVEG